MGKAAVCAELLKAGTHTVLAVRLGGANLVYTGSDSKLCEKSEGLRIFIQGLDLSGL